MIAPLFVLALVGSGPAALADNAEFQSGVTFYTDLEFEQALVKFRIASGSPSLTTSEQASILTWIAITYGGMGDNAAARQSFKDAFALDPEVGLPELTPPTLTPIADEEREVARKAAAERAAAEALAREAEAAKAEAAKAAATPSAPDAALVDDAGGASADSEAEAPSGGLPWLLIGGGAAAATGLATAAVAAGMVAWGASGWLFATDPSHFQSEADAAVLQMNVAFAAAGGLGIVAVGLAGGGAAIAAAQLALPSGAPLAQQGRDAPAEGGVRELIVE